MQDRGPVGTTLMGIEPTETAVARPRARLTAISLTIAGVVLAVDQLTKSLALDALADGPIELFWTLRLNLSFNTGVAFSAGRGLTPLITVVGIVLLGVLVVMTRRVDSVAQAVPLGLLLGGAAGNLSDRLLRDHGGAVVDFIDLGWWPIFNVADMALTCGVVLFVIAGFRE